ncbi:MAG: amidoligase family protein, partial [Pseudomonadota bacterium]
KVVPAEIVTAPLSFEQVVTLSNALKTLEQDGAKGSQDGALYGFGVHLNAEVTGIDDPFTLRTIRAFAVLDPFLRHAFPVDLTRRILPFIKAWPDAFTRQLVENRPGNMAHIMELAAHHTPSRNYALDLFPLFKEADPRAFEVAFPDDTATKPRPSFHFRLPDSRMGERGWSLLEAWNMWRLIERVAHDPRTLEALQKQWLQDHDNGQSRQTEEAAARTDALLKAHLS